MDFLLIITIRDKKGVSVTFHVKADCLLDWELDPNCPFVDTRGKPIHENPQFITFKNFGETVEAENQFVGAVFFSPVFGQVWQKFYDVENIPTHPPIPA